MSSFEEELEQHGSLVFPNKGRSRLPPLRAGILFVRDGAYRVGRKVKNLLKQD